MRKKSSLWLIAFFALFAFSFGCGGPQQKQDLAENGSMIEVESESLSKVDHQLNDIEARTASFDGDLQDLQKRVVEKVGKDYKPEDPKEDDRLRLEIDDKNVLRLNGVAISKSELEAHLDRRGKKVCTPKPVVVVDPVSDYNLVAWALERVYDQGCMGVDIIEAE